MIGFTLIVIALIAGACICFGIWKVFEYQHAELNVKRIEAETNKLRTEGMYRK